MKHNSRNCPLCASTQSQQLATMDAQQIIQSNTYYDDSLYTKLNIKPNDSFSISQCTTCQFVFSSSIPSQAFLSSLYETNDTAGEARIFARPDRAAFLFKSLSTLLTTMARLQPSQHQKKLRILDIGCAYGVGSLGLAMQHYPYEISGVELSESTRNYLEQQGMTTYRTTEDIPSNQSFDGILLNDILEHIPEPLNFLEKIRSISHPNTAIWVNVPNFVDWRLSTIVQQANSGSTQVPKDFNPWEHLSYFSPQSLDHALATIGAHRLHSPTSDYAIRHDSIKECIKTSIRFVRDIMRLHQNTYFNRNTTTSIYTFTQG